MGRRRELTEQSQQRVIDGGEAGGSRTNSEGIAYGLDVTNASDLEPALMAWFGEHGRDLDVRAATAPWEVLVLEVMSQQTQIDRVGPYWRRFLEKWPTPSALAAADNHELLRAWAGLGYNRRALALRECARTIVTEHAGDVPADLEALLALPGIGPYTARAIAATAFGRPYAPLDVNVARVVRRVTGATGNGATLQAKADALVSRDDPRGWVAAVMDLAVAVCTRRRPRCGACPISANCLSRGTPGDVPRRRDGQRFETTNRWLRGRILAHIRDGDAGAWTTVEGPIGSHDRHRVRAALESLAEEGFLVVDGDRARLA